ncbi:MAG: hypothetical protein ACREOW_12850 [Thermodesulfobacteriota bacterium]
MFLDSDDMLIPTAVRNILPYFKNPVIVNVHWPLWEIDETGRKTGNLYPEWPLREGNLRKTVILNGPDCTGHSPTSGNAWTRKFLKEVQPVPEWGDKHGVDCYLLTLIPIYGSIKRDNQPQGYYRIHCDNSFRRSTQFMIKRFLTRYFHQCRVLNEHLSKMGIKTDQQNWNLQYEQVKAIPKIVNEIEGLIPIDNKFILVDEDFLGRDMFKGNRTIPLMECHGKYWGPPNDDETAIKELERLRRSGANYIVFVQTSFWWLEYYTGFHKYLRSKYRFILENERLVVFDLRK